MKDGVLGGLIGRIQHFCVHDGRGLRTTIFFQGCMLHCAWCQNPELISLSPVMMYAKQLCTQCRACVDLCPHNALANVTDVHPSCAMDVCENCLVCEKECVFRAREFSSHWVSLEDVMAESLREKAFYAKGGGVTFSGGEPLLQSDFCKALALKLRHENISVTVETAGFVPWSNIDSLIPFATAFYYDLKVVSRSLMSRFLGTQETLMLTNLRKLAQKQANIILRIPLIPQINGTTQELHKIFQFGYNLRNVKEIHLLPFHQLGAGKYAMIGKPYKLSHMQECAQNTINIAVEIAHTYGFKVNVGGTGFDG